MKSGRHICTVCNSIYEEFTEKLNCGCSSSFNELPEDWTCTECGADKDKFQPCSCITVSATQSLKQRGEQGHANNK